MAKRKKDDDVATTVAAGHTAEELLPPVGHRLRETGNGPNVSYEEALLRQYFGEPDSDGVYGAPDHN